MKQIDEEPVLNESVPISTPLPSKHPFITIGEKSRAPILYGDKPEMAEIDVDHELRKLDYEQYIVFRDLIIPSGIKSLPLTQIDHVVVSVHGIFCIETKSNSGFVLGRSIDEYWKQYLGKQVHGIYSPYRQNDFHVTALENLLHGLIMAPIHSYIAFPNAGKVVIDGDIHDMSINGVINKINNHQRRVYSVGLVKEIAKTLAYAASMREELRPHHIEEVRKHIQAKLIHAH